MSVAKMEKRAETMVLWFDAQPNFATLKTDTEIAVALHAIAPHDGWVHSGSSNAGVRGNPALVRQVRRWIDRQATGQFGEYVFGIKRTGGGRHWTHLYNKKGQITSAEIGSQSASRAGEMMTRRHVEERAREAMKWNAQSEDWFQLSDFQRSIACRDAANDYEQIGYLRPMTKAALERLGLT